MASRVVLRVLRTYEMKSATVRVILLPWRRRRRRISDFFGPLGFALLRSHSDFDESGSFFLLSARMLG